MLHGMTSQPSSWKCDGKSKIRLHQLTPIYFENVPAKCHPNLIDWNDAALFFKEVAPTAYHLSWDVLLWAPPLGVVWRQSCSLELMAFLITFSSLVSCHGLEGAVLPFWTAPGLMLLHCISARLVLSFSFLMFLTLSFYRFFTNILSFLLLSASVHYL